MKIFLIINYLARPEKEVYKQNMIVSKQKNVDTSRNNKEQFLSNIFYFLEKKNYSLAENYDFGFKKVTEINFLIEKKQFSSIKDFVKNNFLVKNVIYNTAHNNGTIMVEFKDSTYIQLEFIWSFNESMNKYFNIEKIVKNTILTKNNFKVLNNIDVARFIALFYFEQYKVIPNKYRKYGIPLLRSKNELDKLIFDLYFHKNITEIFFKLNTIFLK